MAEATKKQKFKINRTLATVLTISVAVHVVGALILGGITIVKYVLPDEAQFEEPPEISEEPPPPEVKIEIKPRPSQMKNSMQNLKLQQVKNIAVSDLDLDMPDMSDSFTVSAGIGGFGGGNLLGGASGSLNIGMSNINVFGLKTKAERILFLIDGSRHMLVDEKGGLFSYNIIKDEITSMVGNLSAGALFNVGFYDRGNMKLFKPQLVPAGAEVTQELKGWIAPINSDPEALELVGSFRYKPENLTESPIFKGIVRDGARGSENARLTQFALEQNVDAIFFITGRHDGFHGARREFTEEENRRWQEHVNSAEYQQQLAAHEAEIPEMRERIKQKLARLNKERAAKGIPPKILSSQWGHYSNAGELDLDWTVDHPGWQDGMFDRNIKPRELEDYFDEVLEVAYPGEGQKAPSINVVVFLAEDEPFSDEKDDQIKDFVRHFDGKHRIIRGLAEITRAASAADTRND